VAMSLVPVKKMIKISRAVPVVCLAANVAKRKRNKTNKESS